MSKRDESTSKDPRQGAPRQAGTTPGKRRPHVLFVCQSNAGKSQIAASLLRWRARGAVEVTSAGTEPAQAPDEQARRCVEALGASFDAQQPQKLTGRMLRCADRVVVLGSSAEVEPVDGMAATIERWVLDEPSERGIDGEARMSLVRDEIDAHVAQLLGEIASGE